MEYIVTCLILAALAALLFRHVRQSKKRDQHGFDGDLPDNGRDDHVPPSAP